MRLVATSSKTISLSKRHYYVIYPCCQVLQMGLETTPCWSCGEVTGLSFYDIPLTNKEHLQLFYTYKVGTSTIYMQMSKVTSEYASCPHP